MHKLFGLLLFLWPCFALASPPQTDFDEIQVMDQDLIPESAELSTDYSQEEADIESLYSGNQCDLQVVVRRFGDRFYSDSRFSIRKSFRGSGHDHHQARLNSFSLYFNWLRQSQYFGSNYFSQWSFAKCW
jgi:hypothetical protein